MNNPYGEFTLHALLYVARLLAEQRYDEVLQLGLRYDQAEIVEALSIEDLHTLSFGIRCPFLAIGIEADAFDLALTLMQRRRAEQQLDRALIQAGARFDMMYRLSGLTTDEFARYRRFLDIRENRGRPQLPSDQQQQAIWRAWTESQVINEKQRYLEVHAKTGAPVGTIWNLVKSWQAAEIASNARKHKTAPQTADS